MHPSKKAVFDVLTFWRKDAHHRAHYNPKNGKLVLDGGLANQSALFGYFDTDGIELRPVAPEDRIMGCTAYIVKKKKF